MGCNVQAGDDIDSAKSNLDNANVQYFNAIKNLSPGDTQGQKKLQNQILAPAQNSYNESLQKGYQDNANTVREEGKKRDKALNRPKVIPIHLGLKEVPRGSDSSSGTRTSIQTFGGPSKGFTATPASGPARPEYVLDGRGIPKEIQFGSPKSSKSVPSGVKKPDP